MAVKVLQIPNENKRAIVEDLQREIDLMKTLKHPNIVRYLGAEVDNSRNILNTDIEKSRIKGYERIILAEQIRSSDLDSDTKKDLMFKISPISEKIADSPALEEEEKKFLLGELNKGDQTHKIESEQISQLCKANFLAAEEWAVKIRSTLFV